MIADDAAVAQIVAELSALRPTDPVAVDTETTGTQLYTGDVLRGISLAYNPRSGTFKGPRRTWYVPTTHPASANVSPAAAGRLGRALRDMQALLVTHNGPGFDWASLADVGFTPPAPGSWWDTQIVSWLMDENTVHSLKGLGALVWGEDEKEEQAALKALFKGERSSDIYRRLREEGWPVQAARLEAKDMAMASKKRWDTLTAEDIAPYAEKDADLTLRLNRWQVEQLDKGGVTDPRPAIAREFEFAALMYRIVERGVAVDEGTVRANRLANLRRIAEIEPAFDGVNLNSPKQLARLIYEEWGLPARHYTKKGAPSTSRDALEELEGAHESLDLLVEYRRLAKSVSTYYDPILANTDSGGRIHAGFCTTCTKTGRLSSRGPNMMNLPREDTDAAVKKVFRPAPGFELWEFDLKSAELFVGASVAQDDDMLAALTEPGRDFHSETAMSVFGTTEGNRRTLGKNLNYGIPYGIGPGKFATYVVKGTGRGIRMCEWCREREGRRPGRRGGGRPAGPRVCDVCFSRQAIQMHRAAWPQTHIAIDRLTDFARRNGYVPLHKPGRFRRFRSPGVIVPYYTAFNAIVQGGVAELMKDVMLAAEAPAEALGAFMVLQVHDSLWFELAPGTHELVEQLLQEATDGANPGWARLTWDAKRLA